MAVTVGGTSITFNDGSVQSTAAGAPTTTQVLNATAAASVGGVGTYAYLVNNDLNVVTNPGNTVAGSSLRYSGIGTDGAAADVSLFSSTSPSGTWRCMGYSAKPAVASNGRGSSLWLRIS